MSRYEIEAIKKQAELEANANSVKILQVCELAGVSTDRAADFIAEGLSASDVLIRLQTERQGQKSIMLETADRMRESAEARRTDTRSTATHPRASTEGDGNIMLDTADRMRESADARRAAGIDVSIH